MESDVVRSPDSTPISLWNRGRRALIVASIAAAMIVPIACSDSSTEPDTPTTPVGSYTLSSLNGKNVPVTLFSDTNYLVTLTAASLSLTADGNYQAISTQRETVAGHLSTYVDTTTGTWIQGTAAGTLVFTDRFDGRKVTGTWAGFNLTLADSSEGTLNTAVYRRR
jgi:hypothetical protein